MLVLRRRAGEAILIGGDVEIEVIDVSRTRVKLGIRAPRSVSVSRREASPVAIENRTAFEFLKERGLAGMNELLRLLETSRNSELKHTATPPISHTDGTAGHPAQDGEPRPGMMPGTYL